MATKKPTQRERMQELVSENIAKQMTAHPERTRRQNIAVAMAISAQTQFPKDKEEKREKPAKKKSKR
jgi:Pyruvate/2-oxoacid:ferredoxin oxidoreductase gamma subunit